MAAPPDQTLVALLGGDRTLRSQTAQRIVTACVVALALCLIGWPVAAVWILASSLVRLIQLSALPIADARLDPRPWWRTGLGHLGFLVSSAVRGALVIPMWTLGGAVRGLLLVLGRPQAPGPQQSSTDPLCIGKISRALRSAGVFRQPSPPVRADRLGFAMNGADRAYGPPASGEGLRDHGEDA